MTQPALRVGAAACLAFISLTAWAQTTTPPSSNPAPASNTPLTTSGETVQMDAFKVNDVPADEAILPTARPFNSVFGTEDNILNVPRSVTIISREQMDTIGIEEVTDFSKLTASSYTDSNFGAPGNPSIRGQSADIFVNGMRQRVTSNGNGAPLDFNSVESVNIVKGPATAVQGASGYVGGFADLITKQPFFDGFHGSVGETFGSYGTDRWNLDLGGPLSSTLAYRVSYSGEHSNEWWNGAFKHIEAVYAALTWRPTPAYQLEINAKEFAGKYSENFGIDRPTQLLISDGLYQTGININNGAAVAPSDSQNSKYIIGGFGSNTVAWGPLVPVNYHWRLQGPGSESHAHEYNAQAIQTLLVNPDFKIVDNTFWSLTQRDTYGTHYYSEIIAPTWFVNNRTEGIWSIPALNNSTINVGFSEYLQHTLAYDDFFFEPANVWDLSKARSGMILDSVNFPLSFASAGNFPGGPVDVPVPGWPGRYANASLPYNGDSNNSWIESVAPFAQTTWHLAPVLNFVSGARIDMMHVSVADPLTPGTRQSLAFSEPNINESLVYIFSPTVSAYATYNLSKNYTGALANGGGVTGWKTDAFGNFIDVLSRDNFEEPSSLYEVGLKNSFLNNQIFITYDIFDQSRQQKAQGQPATQEKFHGAEFELNYQPDKHFYATLAYSLLVGSLPAPAPFQAYSTNQVPNGPPVGGTDQTTGNLRVPGYPLSTFTGLVSYKMDNGVGASLNGVVTSPINNDYQGYLVIPWQETIDGSVFYAHKAWSYKLGVTNLANAHNWTPAYPTYGLESIIPDPGIQFFVTVKLKF